MPYYWNHTNAELDINKSFTHGGTSYPRQWLQRSSEAQRTELGLVWRDAPVYKNEKYYRNLLLASGGVGSIPRPLDGLKEGAMSACKKTASSKLSGSDWMVIRATEGGTAVPEDWAAYRTAVCEYSNSYEVAIGEATFESIQNMRAEWPESPDEKVRREEMEAADEEAKGDLSINNDPQDNLPINNGE